MATAAGFDGDRYLRRLGERAIVQGDVLNHPIRGTPVTEAARALLAVDAIDAATAEEVAHDYRVAGMLRVSGGGRLRLMLARQRLQSSRTAPRAQRLVRCRGVIEHPAGTVDVRYARLWSEGVDFAVTIQAPVAQARSRRGPFNPGGSVSLSATDDQGTTVNCGFTGSWSEQVAHGRLASDHPLSLDTAWLELDGTRLQIDPEPPAPAVAIEPVPDDLPAHRYLWHWVATATHFHHDSSHLETVIEALVAAGALAADDRVIDASRYVAEHRTGPGGRHRGNFGRGAASPPAGVPDRWRSVLRGTRSSGGPDRSLLPCLTVQLDGNEIAVPELAVDDSRLTADVLLARSDGRSPLGGADVENNEVAWWACDDRGHWYVGSLERWSGGPTFANGTVEFLPHLDERATEVRLMAATLREQAVIAIPLDWRDADQ